eukprot:7655805-Pyramimonas_sp.AAC.1
MNALDRPVWDVTDKELSRAFRKISLKIHPDKNPEPRAREAFDKLNSIYQMLQDESQRGELVRAAAERAKKMEKKSWNPAGKDLQEELGKVSAAAEEKRELLKEEANGFANEIAAQMRLKRARSQYKKALERRERESDSGSDDETVPAAKQTKAKEEDDDEGAAAAIRSAKMRANAQRKKKKFIV